MGPSNSRKGVCGVTRRGLDAYVSGELNPEASSAARAHSCS